MKSLPNKISILQMARFMQANVDGINVDGIEFLANGQRFREQIEKQWQRTRFSADEQPNESQFLKYKNITMKNNSSALIVNPRLRFLYTPLFRQNMKILKGQTLKMKLNEEEENGYLKEQLKFKNLNGSISTKLITDHFFHAASSLAKLYNIQRERKIWWMRISADPSRYYLEPFELYNKEDTVNVIPNAQSITIKARFPFGNFSVEHITLVPLNEAKLENESDFEIYNKRTEKWQLPAVVRSVVDFDIATCALLFDATANSKRENTLFLNRNLTPYQCLVTSAVENETNNLKDLCTHLTYVIQRAGLRILDTKKYLQNEKETNSPLKLADELGIPYSVMVNPDSLTTGLLKLRSRDTTLEEIIHISDIPGYLLNIFRAS